MDLFAFEGCCSTVESKIGRTGGLVFDYRQNVDEPQCGLTRSLFVLDFQQSLYWNLGQSFRGIDCGHFGVGEKAAKKKKELRATHFVRSFVS
jgi:hypothetical protein